jgi:DNA-binding transcriptional ArsR family regulator
MSWAVRALKRELAKEGEILACAEQFGLVGDPTRMKICWLLCHHRELSVGDIAETLGVSVSVVSHSLRKLRALHLVRARRKQRRVFYHLADPAFRQVLRLGVAAR